MNVPEVASVIAVTFGAGILVGRLLRARTQKTDYKTVEAEKASFGSEEYARGKDDQYKADDQLLKDADRYGYERGRSDAQKIIDDFSASLDEAHRLQVSEYERGKTDQSVIDLKRMYEVNDEAERAKASFGLAEFNRGYEQRRRDDAPATEALNFSLTEAKQKQISEYERGRKVADDLHQRMNADVLADYQRQIADAGREGYARGQSEQAKSEPVTTSTAKGAPKKAATRKAKA